MIPELLRTAQSWTHRLRHSLSGRVLWLTVAFVLFAEILLWVPSITRFHQDRLMMRLAAAQIAVLSLEQIESGELKADLRKELLQNAGARAVALKRNQTRQLYLAEPMPPAIAKTLETRNVTVFTASYQAFDTLFFGSERVMRIIGVPRFGGGEIIEVVADESELVDEMVGYTGRIAQLSILIAIITSVPLFIALQYFLVRPMQRLMQSMSAFQQHPEDPTRIIVPGAGQNEIAEAEHVLARMQTELRAALKQKAHLAALGLAVAKIQHDLRNILTTAQLTSDRLSMSDDPKVKQLAPRLVQSIDRAIMLANNTLKYGRAEEAPPNRKQVSLQSIVDEASVAALAAGQGRVAWVNAIPADFMIMADPQQLLRIMLNVTRNAVEALESNGGGEIKVTATRPGPQIVIDIADNGPGIPDAARDGLFQPFASRTKEGGSGLGLSIARELARGHGGELLLLHTGPEGTVFRLSLPEVSS